MNISLDTRSIYSSDAPQAKTTNRPSRVSPNANATVEHEIESVPTSSSLSMRRELTPEERERVAFLKNMLMQTLTLAQGDPTEEQKTQIRDIENELEKITGVKPHTRISNMTAKLPGVDDDERKKRKEEQLAMGIDPKDAIHNNLEIKEQSISPAMQMLRKNAYLTQLSTFDLSSFANSGF